MQQHRINSTIHSQQQQPAHLICLSDDQAHPIPMAFNPNPPGLGFPYFPLNPYFPSNPYFPTPPPQPQAPPRFPPPFRPPPRRAPPPAQPLPPRRPPPPPTLPPPRRAPPPPSPRCAPPPPSSPPPPPRRAPPPPSPPIRPPPTPHPRAPPPPRPLAPPPPHINPPTPPPSPPPQHIVIIVVFVSLGCLLLLGCLAALFCLHKKKRGRKTERKVEILNFSDHVHVHKDTVPGPEGAAKAVKLTVDEDIKFQEAVEKQDAMGESSSTGAAGKTPHHSSWLWHKIHEGREDKETVLINVTEHKHLEEKIVPGPHGDKIEVLSEDEDIRFEEAAGGKEESKKSKARIFKS